MRFSETKYTPVGYQPQRPDELTVTLTAWVRPGVIAGVTYGPDGRIKVSREEPAYHASKTQLPLFRLSDLPEAIDVEATGRALIAQFEPRDFDRRPTLVLPPQT